MALHVSVLPKDLVDLIVASSSPTSDLRFVRLPHPRTNVPCLFLPYKTSDGPQTQSSILELQAVSPDAERSWFLDDAQVIADGRLFLSTPIDPAFLLPPLFNLCPPVQGEHAQYLPIDHLFDLFASQITITAEAASVAPPDTPNCNADILHLLTFPCIHGAMRRICDVKELGEDLSVYRFSQQKLIDYARAKVTHLSSPHIFDGFPVLVRSLAKDGLSTTTTDKQDIVAQARSRAACELVSQYLSPEVYTSLLATFDFSALEAYRAMLVEEDAMALKTTTSSAPAREEKGTKRKAEKQGSRGVEKLKKVNTTGMSKLSAFFQKK